MTLRNKLEELGKIKRVNRDEKGEINIMIIHLQCDCHISISHMHTQTLKSF